MPGRIQIDMLRKLAASPDGQGGFRKNEVSQTAVKHWQVRLTGSVSDRIDWYEITDYGRAVLAAYEARHG